MCTISSTKTSFTLRSHLDTDVPAGNFYAKPSASQGRAKHKSKTANPKYRAAFLLNNVTWSIRLYFMKNPNIFLLMLQLVSATRLALVKLIRSVISSLVNDKANVSVFLAANRKRGNLGPN